MRLIFLGAPGSGKGTQAHLLAKNFELRHVATGDILREAVRLETPAGRQAKPFLAAGKLVPDTLINDVVAELFRQGPPPEKFIMDGYPRTLVQAHALDSLLKERGFALTAALYLKVDDEELVRRLSGRWNCPNCKATFHTLFNPPKKPRVCDECGTALVQREDDKEATVRERLRVYHDTSSDLIPHYKAQGLLREVPGIGDIENIYSNITRVL